MSKSSSLSLSVVIPTKNRPILLEKCLNALLKQSGEIAEIIIVDNNSSDQVNSFLLNLKDSSLVKIIRSKTNICPHLYNLGAKASTAEVIAFLDDDCIVSSNWALKVKQFHLKHHNSIAVGKTISVPRDNFYAQLMASHYASWIETNLNQGFLTSIDTKNVSMPKEILVKNNFFLEIDFSSHDIEFGKRVFKKGYQIFYEPNIQVFHQERKTLVPFIKQHLRMAKSEAVLDCHLPKEERIGLFTTKKTVKIIRKFFKNDVDKNDTNSTNSFKIFLIYILLFFTRVFGYLSVKLKTIFRFFNNKD